MNVIKDYKSKLIFGKIQVIMSSEHPQCLIRQYNNLINLINKAYSFYLATIILQLIKLIQIFIIIHSFLCIVKRSYLFYSFSNLLQNIILQKIIQYDHILNKTTKVDKQFKTFQKPSNTMITYPTFSLLLQIIIVQAYPSKFVLSLNLLQICHQIVSMSNIIFPMEPRQCELISGHQIERKNQKNIYVQKINSLIKLSRQGLQEDEHEITNVLNKKKIKKARSELGKNAFKLQKNRESAKRARLRKKLYIKLLESQVNRLKELASEGERIEKQSQKFLAMINRKEEVNQQILDEVERYLSRDNLNDNKNAGQQKEDVPARMDKLVEEICQISACSSLRNIRELSSQISLDDILKAQTVEDKQTAGQQLQEIIKEVMFESEELRQIYMQMMMENEKVKKIIDEGNLKKQEFLEQFPLSSDSNELNLEQPHNPLLVQQFCSYLRRPNQPNNIFINLIEAERILIQATSFLDVNAKFEEI